MVRPLRITSIGVVSAALVACAAPSGSDGSPGESSAAPLSQKTQSIARGAAAPDDSAIFFVEVTTESVVGTCSATLITPRLLLTAAHCLSGQIVSVDCDETRIEEALPASSFRVSSEPNLTGTPSADWVFPEISRVRIVHEGALLCGNDVGLIELAEAIDSDVATPISVPIAPPLQGSSMYRAVGYGAGHPSGTGEKVRRTSDDLSVTCANPIDCDGMMIEGAAGSPSQLAPTIVEGEWVGSPAGCSGDSGGPALLDVDGEEQVVGVLSRGTNDCVINVYTFPQSSEFRANVRDMIRTHESGLIDEFPSWSIDPEFPEEPQQPAESGGAGGAGGSLPTEVSESDPEEEGGLDPLPGPACSCQSVGRRSHQSAWSAPLLLLLSLFFWGARRRPAVAQPE